MMTFKEIQSKLNSKVNESNAVSNGKSIKGYEIVFEYRDSS